MQFSCSSGRSSATLSASTVTDRKGGDTYGGCPFRVPLSLYTVRTTKVFEECYSLRESLISALFRYWLLPIGGTLFGVWVKIATRRQDAAYPREASVFRRDDFAIGLNRSRLNS